MHGYHSNKRLREIARNLCLLKVIGFKHSTSMIALLCRCFYEVHVYRLLDLAGTTTLARLSFDVCQRSSETVCRPFSITGDHLGYSTANPTENENASSSMFETCCGVFRRSYWGDGERMDHVSTMCRCTIRDLGKGHWLRI